MWKMMNFSRLRSNSLMISSRIFALVLLLLLALPMLLCTLRQWSPRIVTTKMGLVRGFLFLPKNYEGVEVFLGLPYASAPVGTLRFMPPVSGSPWSGTKMTEDPAPVCPQVLPDISNETEALKTMPRGRLNILRRLFPMIRNQSEDCLFLNIYIPLSVATTKPDAELPVLVFVHGDDYSFGAGHPYDPSMLASQGSVIVVTMNYRVGILGFLNANSDGYFKSPANFALLDQIAALHWVQENIVSFGGDRTNVTLMGHGKGGVFVNFLMISSAVPTGLLFHRVILMSGSALSPWAHSSPMGPSSSPSSQTSSTSSAATTVSLTNGKIVARRFAQRVKCPSEPPSSMLQCLRQIPLQFYIESELWSTFGPSEDGVIIEEGFREPVLRDRLSRYPLLFGVTKAEMLPYFSDHDAAYGLETEKRREVLKKFVEKFFSVHRNEILAAAIHEYTDWERPVQHPISVRDETLDALGDAQVVAPVIKAADLHSQSNSKSYFYVFEYQSKVSDYAQRLGCVHGEDLLYVFGVPLFFYATPSSSSSLSSLSSSGAGAGPGPGAGTSGGNGMSNAPGADHGSGGSGSSSVASNSNSNPGSGSSQHQQQQQQQQQQHQHQQHQQQQQLQHFESRPGERENDGTPKLGFFSGNFTRNEVQLSQTVMLLWSNFIRTGNPNEGHADGESGPSAQGGSNRLVGDKSKGKLIEWPPYDVLYKKYITIDMKPRVKTHYRAHKLSFWLHLVPDLMKNGYGTSGNHHALSNSPGTGYGNSNAGQAVLSSLDASVHNSSTPSPPTIQLVGPPMWEHNPNYHVNMTHHGGETVSGSVAHGHGQGAQDGDGFQLYSTALSVTIAIGCSLLILNILIFAAFYYQRDKRRNSNDGNDGRDSPNSQVGSSILGGSQHQIRRKENGQIVQLTGMPNICGELPAVHPSSGSECGDMYGSTIHSSHRMSTMKRNENKQMHQQQHLQQQQQQRTNSSSLNLKNNYEMTMPDAIIAAAMMNISFDSLRHDGSPDYSRMTNINRNFGRRSSLTLKEQMPGTVGNSGQGQILGSSGMGMGGGSSVGSHKYESGSQTCPRPPKRTTPTVKFSPETNIGSGNSSGASGDRDSGSFPGFSQISSSQTLKPSLKKNYSSYSPVLDDLKV